MTKRGPKCCALWRCRSGRLREAADLPPAYLNVREGAHSVANALTMACGSGFGPALIEPRGGLARADNAVRRSARGDLRQYSFYHAPLRRREQRRLTNSAVFQAIDPPAFSEPEVRPIAEGPKLPIFLTIEVYLPE